MADNYAIIGVAKLKTTGNIKGVAEHMERSRETINANGRANDVLITPPPFEEITERIRSYLPRKNAVLAYDFLMTASPDFFRGKTEEQVRQWERDSIAWCKKTFGSGNVIAAICHRDETTPHIQAIIIPDYEGKLNARHFTGGREKLRGLWTSYAQAMQTWGLKRGKLYSPAEHKAIKEYYADINQAAEIAIRGKLKAEQLPEPGLKDHANPRQYAAGLINYAIERLQKQNANLRTALKTERQEKEKAQEAAAKDRELYSFLRANPDAFRTLEKELEQERRDRAADNAEHEKLLEAIRTFFRKNINTRSTLRKPENLGLLKDFPELAKDIRLSLKPDGKPAQGMTRTR